MTMNFTPPVKGERRGGRQKGTPNKRSALVKEALSEAFEKLGGVAALVAWAQTDEGRPEFYKLWVKMLPVELSGQVDVHNSVKITVSIPAAAGDERAYRNNVVPITRAA